jgi:hypothetical protein
MFRFTVEQDKISKFIRIQDTLILRPMEQSKLHTSSRVMVDQREKHDPFKYILNVRDSIHEWWITLDSKDKTAYNTAKDLFINDNKRLP